jgi:hypothetical protein
MVALINFFFFAALIFIGGYFFIRYEPKQKKYKYKIVQSYSAAFNCFFYQVLIDGIHYISVLTLEEAELIIERHKKNIQVKL